MIAATLVLFAAGCSRNRDHEAQALIDDLERLGDNVESIVRDSPDEAGLARAEALIGARGGPLHARVLVLDDARTSLSPAASLALTYACTRNTGSAQVVRDYVYNAALKRKPELRKRGNEVGLALCNICKTPSDSLTCGTFERGDGVVPPS